MGMEEIKTINTDEEIKALILLLKNSNLPTDDLRLEISHLVGFFDGGELVGCGGFERYEDLALLRSVAVAKGLQGKAIGTRITNFLLQKAREENTKRIYLLTETAQNFFSKRGFTVVNRSEVPEAIKQSSEFSHVCPSSALVMMKKL